MRQSLTYFLLICLIGLSGKTYSSDTNTTKAAERIVALSPHSVELLFALGVGDKIVATVDYADFPEAAKKIPRIGNYHGIQIENLVAMEPDLIVAWKSGNKSADLEKLHSLGLNMVYTHPKNIDQIFADVTRLATLVGEEEKGRVLASRLEDEYKQIKSRYAEKPPVDVFYQLWHEPMRTVGPKSWIDSLIKDCNGKNIFADTDSDYPIVSIESVIIKNPTVIVIPHHSGNVGAKTDIWKMWPEVDAVKSNRLYTLNGDLLHRFGPRALDGLEKLCEAIDSAR